MHHVTFLTEDIDRLAAFYECVFDARKTLDMTEEGLRHVFLDVGPTTVLHPFQIIAGPALPPPGAMFQRGRLDHFPFSAPSEEAFRVSAAASNSEATADGDVRDMKTMWIMAFHDPDRSYVGDLAQTQPARLRDARTGALDDRRTQPGPGCPEFGGGAWK